MADLNPNLDYRLAELRKVGDEIRAARVHDDARRRESGPTRAGAIRTALGRACLAAAYALLADPTNRASRRQ